MIRIRNHELFRWLARVLPLKYKLNFLIRFYLRSKVSLLIPYHQNFLIAIQPNEHNQRTISDLIFEGARYLPEFALVRRILGTLPRNYVYVDVGANIGTTIWLFAGQAGKVVAFEPIPHLYSTISSSITANQSEHIDLRRLAIGDEIGKVKMMDNDNSSVVQDAGIKGIEIEVSTLDKELKSMSQIDLIKIDVEGFELRVLRGASHILGALRPRLLIEVHPGFLRQYGDQLDEVLNLLDSLGYKVSYYSFLHTQRFGRWKRVLSRYRLMEREFINRDDFLADISRKPELLSYHLYCTPS